MLIAFSLPITCIESIRGSLEYIGNIAKNVDPAEFRLSCIVGRILEEMKIDFDAIVYI